MSSLNIQCGPVSSTSTLSYVTASISAALCLITIPGNLMIIVAVYLDPYRRLRTPFNIVVANLAFADLLVGCITEPLSVYLHIKEGLRRDLAFDEIRVLHLSYFISCTASVLSISLLAIERYISISYSFKYRLYFKKRRFVLVSLVVWLVAIGLSTVYILTSFLFYSFVFINIAVFWTLGVTTFCYVKILRKLKEAQKANVEPDTVIGNTNALSHACPVNKAYVVRLRKCAAVGFGENVKGIDNNGCNEASRVESIDENVDEKDSGFSQAKPSPSTSSDMEESAINAHESVAGSSMNSEKCIENSEPCDTSRELPRENDLDCAQSDPSSNTKSHVIVQTNQNTTCPPMAEQNCVNTDAIQANVATYNEYTSNKYNILVTKTYIMISLVFLACYIPALLIIYTMNWCDTCSCSAIHIMRDLQFMIVIFNSSINPFLYSIRFAHFRRAIFKILQDISNEIFY
ncbi:G-protein coupled receptor 84-like [Dendronephthya gigantea]|uniref:G-protein coupled receptor 84-like n=1 Tax=Dendronephthya gigantea TaxID=151771 RepID=UPI00106C0459|nr:G-protein coupled receptor 84-like [Dendronephthya gigantea]